MATQPPNVNTHALIEALKAQGIDLTVLAQPSANAVPPAPVATGKGKRKGNGGADVPAFHEVQVPEAQVQYSRARANDTPDDIREDVELIGKINGEPVTMGWYKKYGYGFKVGTSERARAKFAQADKWLEIIAMATMIRAYIERHPH